MAYSYSSSLMPPRTVSERTFADPRERDDQGTAEKASSARWLGSTTPILSLLSITLHATLVGLHVFLVLMWKWRWERNLTFPLQYQTMASLGITAISTTFGTVYSAILVYITQTLSTRRNLRRRQLLTATHDIAAAWAGIGSALSRVWQQRSVRSSLGGVLSVFTYLAAILAFHVTTPALFSVEAFNSTQSTNVTTHGLPMFFGIDTSNRFDVLSGLTAGNPMLPLLLYLDSMPTLGLEGPTLYDVLNPNIGDGPVNVNAYTFQMTCGYVTDTTSADFIWNDTELGWDVTSGGAQYTLSPLNEGIITRLAPTDYEDVVFVSTIPIIDANGDTGPIVDLPLPEEWQSFGASATSIQLFRCSHDLLERPAVVDAQSRKLMAITEALPPAQSSWLPFDGNDTQALANFLTGAISMGTPEGFIGAWNFWYIFAPISNYHSGPNGVGRFVAVTDLSLMLNLGMVGSDPLPTSITLQDMENALSKLLASMFWILGHIRPQSNVYTEISGTGTITNLTSLVESSTMVTERFVEARLSLSIQAVMGGLAASVILLGLCLQFLQFCSSGRTKPGAQIDGTDLLHAIWLYRHHPALHTALEEVENPTNVNLRRAGMIRVRLINGDTDASGSMEPLKAWQAQ